MNIKKINFVLLILNMLVSCFALGAGLAFHVIGLVVLGGIGLVIMLFIAWNWNYFHEH